MENGTSEDYMGYYVLVVDRNLEWKLAIEVVQEGSQTEGRPDQVVGAIGTELGNERHLERRTW